MRILILALALAACAPAADEAATEAPGETAQNRDANMAAMPAWDSARAAGVVFRGVGQEPGWMVDVHRQSRIVALLDYGQTLLEFPLPAPRFPSEGQTQYQAQANGRSLTLTIRDTPCQDAMSGESFAATVDLAIDGRTLNGCGRSL